MNDQCNKKAVFFFLLEEREQIASYVREYYPDEVAEVIRKADETCCSQFVFDCRWDLESCFEPVSFSALDGKLAIQWLYQPADDPEWTYSLNRMRYWICLGQAYVLTHDEKYARTFVAQLIDWTKKVKRSDPACAPAWRSIEAGFRLEYWIKAWQYFIGSPSITDEVVQIFCTSIREHAEHVIAAYNHFNVISNWGVLANHGLCMAGIFLADGQKYIQLALERLEKELLTQVYRDGMQWEQSPMYHNEVLHDFLDVLVLAKRNGIALPPVFFEKVRAMCLADCFLQKPDHHQIMMGDSDDLDISYNIARGAYVFDDPQLKYCTTSRFDFDTIWDTGYEASQRYQGMQSQKMPTSLFMQESGNVCIRSDWKEDAAYIHFHCGTLGAGHGHSDQLHIDVSADGEDVLCDSGRYTYVSKQARYDFKNPCAHNTIVVDHRNYCVWSDSWTAHSLCRAINQKCVSYKDYVYGEGAHTGYLFTESGKMSDNGVLLNRRLVYIKPDILLVLDEALSTGIHVYQQFFHFSDTGNVIRQTISGDDEKDPVWYVFQGQKTRAVLAFADCSADGYKTSLTRTQISRHYNQAVTQDTVCVDYIHKGFLCMASCLFLHTDADTCLAVKKIPVTSAITGAPFRDDQVEAWNIMKDTRTYTVVIAHREFAAPTDMFMADGCVGFANAMIFDRTAGTSEVLAR
ncbi:MAG: heparinase II/III family protein [Treponema sp.]|nr:heparinase II/III family protein [Treponema sp.]